jgi:MerR family transcriptional regulator/heat shock protein HspR
MDFDERALYVISVAADLAGVHPQTLRIYERKGLIEPARTEGRSRRYSDRDIALLRRIQELTNAGVGIAGVKRILELEARVAALEAELLALHAEARDAIDRVHRSYRRDLVPLSKNVVRRRGEAPSRPKN